VGVSEDLDLIDKLTRQLQVEWDKFFGGVEKRAPNELKGKLEALIRRYAYQEMSNNAERFRYQSLSTRYSTFAEMWSKRVRALEEGRPIGIHITPTLAHMLHVPESSVGLAPTGFPVGAATAHSAPGPSHPPPGDARRQDPRPDKTGVRTLFEQFVTARQASGETAPVKMESFEKLIEQQTARILTEKGGSAVEFRIETKNGKVSLKARPLK
jgi:hypothetical protein